jgi:hypothetical protein
MFVIFSYCFYAASNYLRGKKSQGAFYSSAFIILRITEMKDAALKEKYHDGIASSEIRYDYNVTPGTYLIINLSILHCCNLVSEI